MQGNYFETVIISDLHLGSEVSRAGDALAFLQSVRFKRLILLGDIFADLNFRRLIKEHWKFLGHIRKLSNPKHGVKVIWVEGNHDHGLTEVMSHLVGIPVYQEYAWRCDGKMNLAIHGHQFDSFAVKNTFLSKVGQFIFLQLQKIDSKKQTFARYLDRLNTRWLRLSEQVAHGALSYAKPGKAERIFCGHTHVPPARVGTELSITTHAHSAQPELSSSSEALTLTDSSGLFSADGTTHTRSARVKPGKFQQRKALGIFLARGLMQNYNFS
jgi:UDP-2,3-diacylglucosamine pyrophosphatase LpxH